MTRALWVEFLAAIVLGAFGGCLLGTKLARSCVTCGRPFALFAYRRCRRHRVSKS